MSGVVAQPRTEGGGSDFSFDGTQLLAVGGVDRGSQLIDRAGRRSSSIGRADQERNRISFADVSHKRQQLVPHPIADEAGVSIRGIIEWREIERDAQGLGVGTA